MDNTQPTNIINIATKRNVIEESRRKIKAKLKPRNVRGTYRSDQVYPERLVMARELLGFSQDDYAEVLGILPMEYRMWEDGTAQPSIEQLHHLAEVTGMFKPGWFCDPVNTGWPSIEETSLSTPSHKCVPLRW